jgi:FtsP/CotA-like multicopper oxidase with cupredoxin domain
VPLVIQDRIFTAGGKMMYILDEATLEDGMHGDVMMVNGIVQPFFKVGTAKYRFRILNGSNARIYKLALSNGASLIQIGTDGGLLQRPKSLASIEIAPSERIDVIIDFSGVPLGTKIVLQNLNGSGRTGSLMRFDVDKKVKDKSRIPEFLVPWEELPEAESVVTREFNLNRQSVNGVLTWVINGQAYNESNPPLARPKFNTIEKWRFVNPTIHPHPMHLHLVQFQVIDIDGEPQDPSDHGWKDTVVVPPGSELTILVKFTDYTGRYVFHCHNLEHEDFAMMAEFEVVP